MFISGKFHDLNFKTSYSKNLENYSYNWVVEDNFSKKVGNLTEKDDFLTTWYLFCMSLVKSDCELGENIRYI